MINNKAHLIKKNATLLDALKKMNDLGINMTLFVSDENDTIIGSLTDGDIRRGLLKGKKLTDHVDCVMSEKFYFLKKNRIDVKKIKSIRNEGVNLIPLLDEYGKLIKIYSLKRSKTILPLDAVIMAGGRGERLKPLTDTIPKPMLLLGGKPIIEHNIDRLLIYGIENIFVSINYLGNQIQEFLKTGKEKGVSIKYLMEKKPLGTAGSLSLVKDFSSDYVIVMNSDLFTDVDFEDLYLETLDAEADMGIASIPYSVNIPYAIFEKEENEVKAFKEKPNFTHFANAGIYIVKKKWLLDIPKNTFYDMTDLIQQILDKKGKIIHNPLIGYWIDIGKHDDYEKAQEVVKHIKWD